MNASEANQQGLYIDIFEVYVTSFTVMKSLLWGRLLRNVRLPIEYDPQTVFISVA